MASPFFIPPTTALKQIFAENTNLNCSNNAVTLLNAAKCIKIRSIYNES